MALPQEQKEPDEHIGRYAIFDEIAKGGMARVHLARLTGPEGFSRVVAVKRMHPQLLEDPDFKRMFVAEARLAARVRHPNVVPILDVQAQGNELIIIMEYVHGEPLHALVTASRRAKLATPARIVSAIMIAVLQGLHAAHEARDEQGVPLDMVHRDVSPHNVIVGADGVARVLDFGVARAVQAHETKPESLKGKFSYMAPEVIRGTRVTRRADIFSAGVVLWELLTGQRLFAGTTDRERLVSILRGKYQSPRELDPTVDANFDRIAMKALTIDPEGRFPNALAMAIELERAVPPASQRIVGDWVMSLAADTLDSRAELIHAVETSGVVAARASVVPAPSWMAPPPSAEESAPHAAAKATTEPSRPLKRARMAAAIGFAFLAASGVAVVFGGRGEADGGSDAAGPRLDSPKARSAALPRASVVSIDSAQDARQNVPTAAASNAAANGDVPDASVAATAPSTEATTSTVVPVSPDGIQTNKSKGSVPARPRGSLDKTKSVHAKDFFPDDL